MQISWIFLNFSVALYVRWFLWVNEALKFILVHTTLLSNDFLLGDVLQGTTVPKTTVEKSQEEKNRMECNMLH